MPQEFVNPSDFTGEMLKFKGVLVKHEWTQARVANVPVNIGPVSFVEKALAVPGEDLGWTAVLRFVCGDTAQLCRVAKLMEWKHTLPEDQMQYVPPTSQDGCAQGAVLVSEGVVVQEDSKECWEESIESITPLCGDKDKVDGIVEETIDPSKLVGAEKSPEGKVTNDEISE